MAYLLLFLSLALNFVISWSNASYVGRYWSESKQVGGSFRVYMVTGYIMAIAGFTMVYGYILLLISPYILPLLNVSQETIIAIQTLSADLIYLFCVVTMIPTGFYIWIRSLKTFFEEKTLSTGLTAGWNTFASSLLANLGKLDLNLRFNKPVPLFTASKAVYIAEKKN